MIDMPAMGAIRVRCGSCSRVLEVHHTAAGSTVACPHCRTKLMVPRPTGPAAAAPPPPPPPPSPPPHRPRIAIRRQSSAGTLAAILFAVVLLGGAGAAAVYWVLSEEERTHEPVIREGFEEIVAAVNGGNAARLARLLDAETPAHRAKLRTKFETYFATARMEITDWKVERVVVKQGVAHLHYSLNNRVRNHRTGNSHLVGRTNAVMQWRLQGSAWLVYEPDLDFILTD